MNKDVVNIFDTERFEDERGFLSVIYDKGFPFDFEIRQINQGYSKSAYTLRGMHFQEEPYSQAKIVTCLKGSILSVAVDLHKEKTFGYAYSEVLSFENHKMMYIPRGFAHGYLTLEDDTLMQWCTDGDFCKEAAKAVRYDDRDIVWQGESWAKGVEYIISEKDRNAMSLQDHLRSHR